MNKIEMHHTIMAAKARLNLNWDSLADAAQKPRSGSLRCVTG